MATPYARQVMGEACAGSLLAVVVLGLSAWSAHRLCAHLWPQAGASVRLCATAVGLYAASSLAGTALLTMGLFNRPVALGLAALAAAVTARFRSAAGSRPGICGDLCILARRAAKVLRGGLAVIVALMGVVLLARLIRGLAAPPLAWDALTYHLVKAGRWVQYGHWAPLTAPDAWGYYEYYPPNGDLVWAWAMLPTRTDLLVAPAGVLVWLTLLLGAGATCRALGARRREALPVALIVASLPAVTNYLTSAYVENMTLALTLLAVPFIQRCWQHRRPEDAVIALLALATAAGVKVTALPFLAAGLAIVAWARPWRPGRRLAVLAGCVMACAPAARGYYRAWIERGSPLYPMPVAVGGRTLLAGNPERGWVHSARIAAGLEFEPARFLRALAIPRLGAFEEHLGLGPLFPFVLVAGVCGAARVLRGRAGGRPPPDGSGAWHRMTLPVRSARRITVLAMLMAGAVVVLGFCLPGERGLRTLFMLSAGRFLALPLALVTVCASVLQGKRLRRMWLVALGVHVVLAVPLGWSREDVAAIFGVLPAVALTGLALVVAWASGLVSERMRSRRRALALAAATGVLVVFSPMVQDTRDRFRYPIYAAAAEGRAYDAHRLSADYASSWPIWRHFDRPTTGAANADAAPAGYTLALTAGFDGIGHNWYAYPLLGRRLQNRVIYVTPIADGAVIDYRLRDEVLARADPQIWIQRLFEVGADAVVTLAPQGPEDIWLGLMSDRFPAIATSMSSGSRAHALDRWSQ